MFQLFLLAACDTVTQQQLGKLNAPVVAYVDGGPQEKIGRASLTLLLAPPIALAFSVFGALVHTFKIAFFMLHCVTGYAFRKWYRKLVAVTGLSVLLLGGTSNLVHNKITEQDIYINFLHRNMESWPTGQINAFGSLIANGIRGVIHLEPYVYPDFEWIRKQLLGGFKFGYVEQSPGADAKSSKQ